MFSGLYIFHGDDTYHFTSWQMSWPFELALEQGNQLAWHKLIELIENSIERYELEAE